MNPKPASSATGGGPLHPPLTDVPIGAIVITAVVDVASSTGAGHSWARELYRAGTSSLMIGTAVLFLAVAAGLLDRARTTRRGSPPRRAVNVHAWLMTAVGLLAIANILVRRQGYPGAQHTPAVVLVLSLITVVVTVIGGALGGKLVYRGGIGVAPEAGNPRGADVQQ